MLDIAVKSPIADSGCHLKDAVARQKKWKTALLYWVTSLKSGEELLQNQNHPSP